MIKSIAVILTLVTLPHSKATDVDFSRDVQPILAEHCYACHGADKAESGLRLDDPDSARSPSDSGETAVVPGDVDASLMLRRIRSVDPDERMPPEAEPLTEKEFSILKGWIQGGAKWKRHWAYRPLSFNTPSMTNIWIRSPLDSFVLSRLQEEDITPSKQASRETLIRRLSLDLLGLPPHVDAVEQFVRDDSPNAYERLVEELLASPRFGERWEDIGSIKLVMLTPTGTKKTIIAPMHGDIEIGSWMRSIRIWHLISSRSGS